MKYFEKKNGFYFRLNYFGSFTEVLQLANALSLQLMSGLCHFDMSEPRESDYTSSPFPLAILQISCPVSMASPAALNFDCCQVSAVRTQKLSSL